MQETLLEKCLTTREQTTVRRRSMFVFLGGEVDGIEKEE